MLNNVYVILSCDGEYEDTITRVDKVFQSKEAAEQYIRANEKEHKKWNDKVDSYYSKLDEWYAENNNLYIHKEISHIIFNEDYNNYKKEIQKEIFGGEEIKDDYYETLISYRIYEKEVE